MVSFSLVGAFEKSFGLPGWLSELLRTSLHDAVLALGLTRYTLEEKQTFFSVFFRLLLEL